MHIISLYLFLIGWTSAFALPFLPIPRILGGILLLLSVILALSNRKVRGLNKKLLIVIYLFVLVIFISFAIQAFGIGINFTGFGHTFLFTFTILVNFIAIYTAISLTNYPIVKVYKHLSWGVVFVSVITIAEFISRNFLNLEFDFLRISRENPNTYAIAGERFFRARGTVVESGHLAMYLLMFAPFVYHYQLNINKSKLKTFLSLLTVAFAVFFTFSAAGFAELALILLVVVGVFLVKLFQKIKLSQILMVYPIVFVIFLCSIYYFAYKGGNLNFLASIIDKLTFANYSIGDPGSRITRWFRAWELFKESPIIGHGSGITSIVYDTGSTSLYLEILTGTGLLGLGLFLIIMFYHLNIIFKLQGNLKYIYLVSFVTMTVHYSVISDYWYPWMWLLFVMINFQFYRQRNEMAERQVQIEIKKEIKVNRERGLPTS